MLTLTNICKSFSGIPVLAGVDLALAPGRTLGLVGENGAGKSTLMNILGGNLAPDSGGMVVSGQPYAPRFPRDAAAAGIAFIHQELNLFPNLSVAENLFLTGFPKSAGTIIDRRALSARARQLLDSVGLGDLSPEVPLDHLPAGQRQLVEIAKALATDPKLIILDEPTTSLTARETDHLFGLLGRLKARGITMVYISHALDDVLRLSDEILVLRDGAVVGHGPREDFSVGRLITLMVGRPVGQLFPQRSAPPTDRPVLEARALTHPGTLHDISFTLHRGEILGVSGLMGSGRTELARTLFGLDPCAEGSVLLDGQPLDGLPPRRRIARGLAFVTEDRRHEGLCMDASIADNITLTSAPRFARPPIGWMDQQPLQEAVTRLRAAVRLTPAARDSQPASTLSGGNQQKVVLAKWLLSEPSALILDEPTRGIDVGAKSEIYKLIDDLAAGGAGVLVISSDVEELVGLCDRILVMARGEIRDAIGCAEFDRERILRASFHTGRLSTA
ncbi:sugar ABC transporter ATP-binding protein [soil metagenome]